MPSVLRRLVALHLLVGTAAATGATCSEAKPRCTSVESSAAGTFSQDTWVPDSGCFVAAPTPEETKHILRGSWLVMCGHSNTMMTSRAMMNQFSPYAFMVSRGLRTQQPLPVSAMSSARLHVP
jgi:hypothetical protein